MKKTITYSMSSQKTQKKHGLFITLYGINNIGKSTHAKRLAARLKKEGFTTHYIKYPIYDLEPTGPLLNDILRKSKEQKISEEELQLWFVLNRYHFQPTLKKWLANGDIVVAEDYCGTGIAWGAAKGVPLKTLIGMNKYLVQENVAILMKGVRDTRAQEKAHIHETNTALIAKTTAVFEQLGKKFKWKNVVVAETKEETEGRIWEVVRKSLNKSR